jgi:hypothetical protein
MREDVADFFGMVIAVSAFRVAASRTTSPTPWPALGSESSGFVTGGPLSVGGGDRFL